MFKKALSLLLAVMLIVTAFSVAMVTVAAADGTPADSSSALKVTATSNFFPETTQSFTQEEIDANDGYVTVTYFIDSEERLLNLDFLLTYDGTVLEFDEAANKTGSGRNAKLDIVRVADDEMINTNPQSAEYGVMGNCTNLSLYYLNAEGGGKTAFVSATFKVIGTGDTTVDLTINDMKWSRLKDGQTQSDGTNDTVMVKGGNVMENEMVYVPTTAVYAGQFNADYVAPETQAPTQAPATQEATQATVAPTTEPAPAEDDTYVVAGDNAEIFGTSWDAGNADNTMTKNDDGTYSKSYDAAKAYDVVQLKVVKNGAEWIGDENGNNLAFALTAPGTFTVTYDPATGTVTATGDNVAEAAFNYQTVYAVGNGEGNWLNGAAWDPGYAANEMTKVADGVYEIVFTDVPDGFGRQIKFAIDGSWTYNFGAPKENAPEFESGTTFEAGWDGANITFDTEDTCDVKAQLDLRDFDFISKTGAKYTITITEKGDEPQPTTAPAETQPATEPAPITGNGFTVVATSNFFPETRTMYPNISDYEDESGNVFVTVEYKMAAPGKYLINLDVDELTWDPSVLEFKEEYNKFGSGRSAVFSIFPFAVEQGRGAGMVNTFGDGNGGRVVGNYTSVSPAAYATEEDGSAITVVRATFKVLDRDAKITTVNLKMDTLSLCDETIKEPYSQDMPIEKCVINPDAYELATYETGFEPKGEDVPVDPTTEPSDPTAPAEDMATVTGSSNFCAAVNGQVVKVGENVTVTFKAPAAYDVVDLQWGMDYDEDKLELVGVDSFTDDMLVNMAAESYKAMGSVTNIDSPYAVAEGADFVSFTFTAKAEGETDVVFTVVDMTVKNGENDEVIFINGVDQREPAAEDTLIVAGDNTDLFGTSWDGTNEANTMTKGEDGKYTKTYTASKAYDVVQLKAVKNGTDWIGDENGNNVAFAVTDAGTFTVTYDPETNVVTVTGDNVAEATFKYTDVYAVGNGEGTWLNGAAWIPDAEANKMNEVSDGVFEIEFKNVPDGFERQIKFAIDGGWTYNFGAPKEDAPVIESGVTYDAAWDGANVTFDTEDLCNVKAQLDLRDFDFISKTGAKYTITITDAEEPQISTEPTAPSEDTTPSEDTSSTEGTTPSEDTSSTEGTTPSQGESVYIVGGSEKEIFGTEMDGKDVNNQMTLVDGKYVKEYTVAKEFSNVKVRTFIDGTASANEVLFDVTKAGSFKVVYDPEKKVTSVEGDNVKVTPVTTGSDATSATSTTAKSSSGSSSSTTTTTTTTSSNGAVQTGTASMAVIILLVLVSATAGIYFARKRVK